MAGVISERGTPAAHVMLLGAVVVVSCPWHPHPTRPFSPGKGWQTIFQPTAELSTPSNGCPTLAKHRAAYPRHALGDFPHQAPGVLRTPSIGGLATPSIGRLPVPSACGRMHPARIGGVNNMPMPPQEHRHGLPTDGFGRLPMPIAGPAHAGRMRPHPSGVVPAHD